MKQQTTERLKEIKSRYRLLMNGAVSRSMRAKGMDYAINWGVSFPELKLLAHEFGKDKDLAIALWKDNVRESKILSTLIMPKEEMTPDLVEHFVQGIPSQEIAEMISLNLLQYIDNAKDFCLKWLSSEKEIELLCAYNVLSRLFLKDIDFSEREINEFIDQTVAIISNGSISVRHAAINALSRFSHISQEYEMIVKAAFGDII